jgi:hypothetical protein
MSYKANCAGAQPSSLAIRQVTPQLPHRRSKTRHNPMRTGPAYLLTQPLGRRLHRGDPLPYPVRDPVPLPALIIFYRK